MMGWLIGGGMLCMIVLMTALCVVSGDEMCIRDSF